MSKVKRPTLDPNATASATLAIVGATVVTEQYVAPMTILVGHDGTISDVVAPQEAVTADREIDASGLHVFPGGVDTHVHFNDPGLTESEDFFTGTAGAVAGGYTTVLEMPQTRPLVDSVQLLNDKRREVAPKAVADFGLYCALVPNNCNDEAELESIARAGAIGFKAFVCDTPEMPFVNEEQLLQGMANLRKLDLPLAVHCESQAVLDFYKKQVLDSGAEVDAFQIALARRAAAETQAVRMVLGLAEISGVRLHLVHISDPRTIQLIEQSIDYGVSVGVETCPHYLRLTREDLLDVQAWGVCNPPLNTSEAVEGLWAAISRGSIDNIASDHCAYTRDEKITSDPWDIGPGITGIQFALPLVVDMVRQRGLPLQLVPTLMSGNPAREFGLYPHKGLLGRGADADLVIVDMHSATNVRQTPTFTRSAGSAYESLEIGAKVVRTFIRGQEVFSLQSEGAKILVEPGFGQFLHPWAGTQRFYRRTDGNVNLRSGPRLSAGGAVMVSDRRNVVVLCAAGQDPPDLAALADWANVTYADQEALGASLPGADVLLVWDFFSRALAENWSRADRLSWIHIAAAGVDSLLFPALIESDVIVTNARNVFDRPMAEYALAAVLAYAKDFRRTVELQQRQQWLHRETRSITGATALIVGTGAIGREVARLFTAVGIEVRGAGRTARDEDVDFGTVVASCDLPRHIGWADYVIVVAPLTGQTRNIINRKSLAAMKPDAYLVNLSRGACVDETDLCQALDDGQLGGAALDVFATEPLPDGHALWSRTDTVVSPHMSGDVVGWKAALARQFVRNAQRYIAGEPLRNLVDKQRGYTTS